MLAGAPYAPYAPAIELRVVRVARYSATPCRPWAPRRPRARPRPGHRGAVACAGASRSGGEAAGPRAGPTIPAPDTRWARNLAQRCARSSRPPGAGASPTPSYSTRPATPRYAASRAAWSATGRAGAATAPRNAGSGAQRGARRQGATLRKVEAAAPIPGESALRRPRGLGVAQELPPGGDHDAEAQHERARHAGRRRRTWRATTAAAAAPWTVGPRGTLGTG